LIVHPLIFIYPRWQIDPLSLSTYGPWLWIILAVMIGLATRRTWGRYALTALGCFFIFLLPVLGFFNIYFMRYSFVADHFQYLASVAPIALFSAVISGRPRHVKMRMPLIFSILLVLGVLTWRHASAFESSEALWRDTIKKNPSAWLAQNNLGNILVNQGRRREAVGHYQKAIEAKPDFAEAHSNLGVALAILGQSERAVAHYVTALQHKPDYAEAHDNLGIELDRLGKHEDAIDHHLEALRIRPDFAEAHHHLGRVLASQGRIEEAIEHFKEALRIRPDYAKAKRHLQMALSKT